MTDYKAKSKGAEPIHFSYDMPTSVKEFVAKFGDEAVAELAEREVLRALRNLVLTNTDKTPQEMQALVDGYVPGARRARTSKTPFERAQAALSGMSKEELAALLQKVKDAAKSA